MSLQVQLNVFSGRQNPILELSQSTLNDLVKLTEGVEFSKSEEIGGLGYRGFSVFSPEGPKDKAFALMESAHAELGKANLVLGAREAEEFLLERFRKEIDKDVYDHIREFVARGPESYLFEKKTKGTGCPPCYGPDAPAYDPGWWNNDQTRLWNNNCYNYANNQATNTFAQPGRGTGQQYTSLTCNGGPGVQPAATRDGLAATGDFSHQLPKGWYVALVIWPNTDYHWYRQDDVGCWSHKPGSTAVRNVDNSGNRITDPKTADRGPYTIFCTYMVTNKGVTIA